MTAPAGLLGCRRRLSGLLPVAVAGRITRRDCMPHYVRELTTRKYRGKPPAPIRGPDDVVHVVGRRLRQEKRANAKPDDIQRFKGLGEMNYPELWETTMNPGTRTLLQVSLDDAATADELFSVLMGEDVDARRSFIQRNAKDVRFLDI